MAFPPLYKPICQDFLPRLNLNRRACALLKSSSAFEGVPGAPRQRPSSRCAGRRSSRTRRRWRFLLRWRRDAAARTAGCSSPTQCDPAAPPTQPHTHTCRTETDHQIISFLAYQLITSVNCLMNPFTVHYYILCLVSSCACIYCIYYK